MDREHDKQPSSCGQSYLVLMKMMNELLVEKKGTFYLLPPFIGDASTSGCLCVNKPVSIAALPALSMNDTQTHAQRLTHQHIQWEQLRPLIGFLSVAKGV